MVAVAVAFAGLLGGGSSAISALLGGGTALAGNMVFAFLAHTQSESATDVVRMMIRAEAAKVTVIVLLLWLCFALYRELAGFAFFGAFVVSVLASGIASAVPDD